MISFDKEKIREQLTIKDHFQLLTEWGGNPRYTSFGIISDTICHNPPGLGSPKLYFYENSGLYICYTGCGGHFMDIFELYIKVSKIQKREEIDLNESIRWIASFLGISGEYQEEKEKTISTADWEKFEEYNRIQTIEIKDYDIVLKEYDPIILDRMVYNVRITPWLKEGITQEVIDKARIGFYPGGDQITIPHYDKNNRFVGLRGRSLIQEDCEKFGKYRPVYVNRQFYSHPLGMNLYNLNNSKDNIKRMGKAIVYEGEKSVLLSQSYFGFEHDINVACCGSNLSAYQVHLLLEAGAKEIIIAYDRQFQEIGDDEFKHLTSNLEKLYKRYNHEVLISFIFDKNKITSYKASPIDEGPEKFLTLFKERIVL